VVETVTEKLAGKVALVTGGSRGIGYATAELFAQEGATVYAGSSSTPEEGFSEKGVEFVRLDVAEEEDWRSVVARIVSRHGRLDVLVNNAGTATYEGVVDLDLSAWHRVVGVVQTGTFLGMREVIPVMRENGGGSIINIGSIWGHAAVPGAHAYQAAKGAVNQMTKNAAITYAADGIRVNTITPGIISTPGIEAQDAAVSNAVIAATPMNRMGRPADIAHGCLYFASDDSVFTTGADLVIDGGYLAQ
jgi:NAD(P)-dependent dehydrogenase (short-subunit alcohol dehydrogenase family)